jgi:uncharacterized protein (TIGR00255 family)
VPVTSMTGFARTEGEHGTASWAVEIKSVNSKGLDVRTRLPFGYEGLEQQVRDLVGRRFQRGSVNVNVALTRRESREQFKVNQEVLDQILSVLPEIQRRLPGATPPSADGLLGVRGVIEMVEAKETEEQRKALESAMLKGITDCLDDVSVMRAAEGKRLAAVLSDQITRIDGLREQAETLASAQPAALRQRLLDQLADIAGQVPALSPERLAQEVVLLVAKADVREELDRLAAHVEAARKMLEESVAVGRKLDFLCQEFMRESNTLCSKSSDVELTRRGLDLKAVIEQFREQVQNIE